MYLAVYSTTLKFTRLYVFRQIILSFLQVIDQDKTDNLLILYLRERQPFEVL